MIAEPSVVEADLAGGRLCCPVCEEPLSAWGFARERTVRLLDGTRSIRPRRACCRGCEQTHVLLPAWAVARRRDGAEVIGRALLANANGQGHRTIAAQLRRPPGTVRGWLRAFARRAEPVASSARRWTHALDADSRSRDPARIPDRARGRRARQRGTRVPATSRDARLAVGARCRAHRPALRAPARPAWVLSRSRCCHARVGRIARPEGSRPSARLANPGSGHGERSQRERSGLNARRTKTRPRPAAFVARRSGGRAAWPLSAR